MADGPNRDFLGTANNEWAVVNGDFAIVAGSAAVPQLIQTGIGVILGECYLDESVGVDYLNQILIKNPDPLVVRALLQAAILAIPDVTNVSATDVTTDAQRNATVSYVADTVYSTQPVNGFVKVP